MDDYNKKEIEASVFRRLVSHLQENTDVQNIDLMDLAGFCRNCLGKWYKEAAEESGVEMHYDDARCSGADEGLSDGASVCRRESSCYSLVCVG